NGVEAYVFSNNPDDDLYRVTFSQVGPNQGHYILSSINAINNIYEYVEPIAGIPQGNFNPIVQLVAPTKLQIAVLNGQYNPTEKTNIAIEVAGSKNDLNLFSSADDANNDGFAGKLKVTQTIFKKDSLWTLDAFADADYIHKNFKTIERLYNAEFSRDWNIDTPLGNQQLLITGLNLFHPEKGHANYHLEHLEFSENFNGNRHVFNVNLFLNKFQITSYSSFLNAKSHINTSTFLRSFNRITYTMNKSWVGTKLAIEDNEQINILTSQLTPLSQKFKSYEVFSGIGDSLKVFTEIGYKFRVNDSIKNNQLQKVNSSNTFYLKSKLIQNNNTNLALYANYRILKNEDEAIEDERSINSRIKYNQNIFKQLLQ